MATVSGDRVTDEQLEAWLIGLLDEWYQVTVDISEGSKKIWLDWAAKHAADQIAFTVPRANE